MARRLDRLAELKRELTGRHSAPHIETLSVDLSNMEQLTDLSVRLAHGNVDLLINNAGLGDHGPVATAESARVHRQIQVNVLALTALTSAVLPQMISRKRGALLNVSSSAGFLPLPGFAVYAATKAYVTSFSEAIRSETRGCGITVTTLCPGPVETEFAVVASRSREQARHRFSFLHVPPEEVVRVALRAVERDKALVIPGAAMKIGMAVARAIPLSLLRFAAPLVTELS